MSFKKITAMTVAIVLSAQLIISASASFVPKNNAVVRVDSGGGANLSVQSNRNSTEKVKINQKTQNNISYENYSNYYDIWEHYNDLFENVKWEKYSIFDHDGDELPSYSSLPSAKEDNFYIIEQGKLDLSEIEDFFKNYNSLYKPYVDNMSRYESKSWKNLMNSTFKPNSSNKLTSAEYKKLLEYIEEFFKQILKGNFKDGISGLIELLRNPEYEFGKVTYDEQGRPQLNYNGTTVPLEPIKNNLTLPNYIKDNAFSDILDNIFDFAGNGYEGKDIERWRYLKEYFDFLSNGGKEGLDITSLTEYTISDYESNNVDKTKWYQIFDWNVYEVSEDVNADDNADINWDVPLYSLATDSNRASISVTFNKAGTYYIGCTQNCDLTLSEKITYAFRRYIIANDTNTAIYVTNSFADNDGVYTLWSEKDTEYVTTYTEKNAEYLIGSFAVHIREEDVNKVMSFDSSGNISQKYTTERVD